MNARAWEQKNAVRCQKCRMDKVPYRYNYCACGMQGCRECITNPNHGGKRVWVCPYCETHHRAQCKCGAYNDQQKNCVRSKFDWETGIAARGESTETVEQEETRKENEKAERRGKETRSEKQGKRKKKPRSKKK